tara:strand:+ start:5190 stop:6104 length:915 start_codon:yes stop_codon:yes gene_type:complete
MGKSAPDPPDYTGAAEAEAGANQDLANQQTFANRPNQQTPWGNINWEASQGIDPATGKPVTTWNQTMGLPEDAQRSLDSQNRVSAGRSELAESLLGRAEGELGEFDWAGLPERQGLEYDPTTLRANAENAMYDSATSRLDPQWNQRTQDTEIKLRNQGLRPGDEAYDNAMGNLERAKGDAYAQAQRAAVGEGRAEANQLFGQQQDSAAFGNTLRQQAMAEEAKRRGMSLNDMNALLSGQQVMQNDMPAFNSASRTQGPAYGQAAANQGTAANNAWSAQNANTANMFSGAGSLMQGGADMYTAFK